MKQNKLTVFHLRVEKNNRIHIGGTLSMPAEAPDGAYHVEVTAGDCQTEIKYGGYLKPPTEDGFSAERKQFVDVFLNPPSCKQFHVSFRIVDAEGKTDSCSLSFDTRAPLSEKTASAYFRQAGWLFRSEPPSGFSVRRASWFRHIGAELRYDAWLLLKQPSRRAKACIPIRWLTFLLRPVIQKRRIWLVMDRFLRADDNGLALFRYLMDHRMEFGCHPVFVLDRDSPEWQEAHQIGPVLPYTKVLFRFANLVAEWTIGSHYHNPISRPLAAVPDGYRGLANDHRFAFLQHGIIKDDMSMYLNREQLDCDIFVTTSERELESIARAPSYGFFRETLVLTGMPRHDRLDDHREKLITFMPTWRRALCSGFNPKTGDTMPDESLEKSPYFIHLRSAVSSPKLLAAAERLGYTIQFLPHPVFIPYANRFQFDPRVRLLSGNIRYGDIYARSSICITDFSSAIFDFAWMKKCVVYYQPDPDQHYVPGYFAYERDGFGPVTHSADELTDCLIDLMERGCPMDEPYLTRAKEFFAFHDQNNCHRVTEAILAASNKR